MYDYERIKKHLKSDAFLLELVEPDVAQDCRMAANALTELEALAHLGKGKWTYDSDGLPICSACGELALQRILLRFRSQEYYSQFVLSKYCPHCGAQMGGESNG